MKREISVKKALELRAQGKVKEWVSEGGQQKINVVLTTDDGPKPITIGIRDED